MYFEIERKFLLRGNQWRKNAKGSHFRQGYILRDPGRTVRIRTCEEIGFLTIKGKGEGITRPEFEYQIPFDDAKILLGKFCEQPILEKLRYKIEFQGLVWEIDEFLGDNAGLIVAEVELTSENQIFTKPDWIGKEVTGDPRYFNASLVNHPYKNW